MTKQTECSPCKTQEDKHGFSVCKIIRWGYIIIFVSLLLSILALSAYLFYLQSQ